MTAALKAWGGIVLEADPETEKYTLSVNDGKFVCHPDRSEGRDFAMMSDSHFYECAKTYIRMCSFDRREYENVA